MRKSSRILVAATFVGLAVAGGAAFTATGLTTTAGSTQFVGGTVTQTVTGATLNGVDYSFSDAPANTLVNSVVLTFANDALGRGASVSLNGDAAISCGVVADAAGVATATCTVTVPVSVLTADITVV
jgi:hypothetical protein